MRCSERAAFDSLHHQQLMMPNIGFSADALLQALPGIIDSDSVAGVSFRRRNCFLMKNGTALMVWVPRRVSTLAARLWSWREALGECEDGDYIFLAA
jgi:hypothetical protein